MQKEDGRDALNTTITIPKTSPLNWDGPDWVRRPSVHAGDKPYLLCPGTS